MVCQSSRLWEGSVYGEAHGVIGTTATSSEHLKVASGSSAVNVGCPRLQAVGAVGQVFIGRGAGACRPSAAVEGAFVGGVQLGRLERNFDDFGFEFGRLIGQKRRVGGFEVQIPSSEVVEQALNS